jgi:hypothetical protein
MIGMEFGFCNHGLQNQTIPIRIGRVESESAKDDPNFTRFTRPNDFLAKSSTKMADMPKLVANSDIIVVVSINCCKGRRET